jgi:hypothetical protein
VVRHDAPYELGFQVDRGGRVAADVRRDGLVAQQVHEAARHKVLGCVVLHVPQAPPAVDAGVYATRLELPLKFVSHLQHVDNLYFVISLEDVHYLDPTDRAGVVPLPPAGGVEVGAVEGHAVASIRQIDLLGNVRLEIELERVFQVQGLLIHGNSLFSAKIWFIRNFPNYNEFPFFSTHNNRFPKSRMNVSLLLLMSGEEGTKG